MTKHVFFSGKFKSLGLFFFILMFFVGCDKVEKDFNFDNYGNLPPGIALNFDDDYFKEWLEANVIIKKYNGCATYNVSLFKHAITGDANDDLKFLYQSGNEIGFHTMNHQDVVKSIQNYGEKKFIENEILPSINFFKKLNIPVTTFAYPFGNRNAHTDSILLKYYDRVRGAPTDYKGNAQLAPFVKERGNKLLYHFFFFDKTAPFSMRDIKEKIIHAKRYKTVLILYAHKPMKTPDSDYSFSFDNLEQILSFAKANGMKFYLMSDL